MCAPRSLIAALVVPLLVLAGCGGDGGGDGGDDPMQPVTVVGIEVDPGVLDMIFGDEATLEVTLQRSDGSTTSATSAQFTSSDVSVATVTSAGVVTATGQGEADIEVTAEGQSATVPVTVTPEIAEETVVFDSTEVDMVSTEEQRADGELRFLGDAAAELEEGDVVVGAQGGGYLRRVASIETRGDTVVAATDFAALSEVVTAGAFQSSVSMDISEAGPATVNGVEWGPIQVEYLAPGVSLDPAGISLEDVEILRREVCAEDPGGAGKVCGSFVIDVPSALVEFAPDFDVGGEYRNGRVREFHAIGSGALTVSADVRAMAQVAGEVKGEKSLKVVSRPFATFIGPPPLPPIPVVGVIRLELVGVAQAKLALEGSVTAGATTTASASMGARYEAPDWEAVFEPDIDYETRPLVWDGKAEATVRFEVKPVFTMILYSVGGPTAGLVPHLTFDGKLDFDECSWEGSVKTGLDMEVGFKVEILGEELKNFSTQVKGLESVIFADDGNLVEELHAVGGQDQTGRVGEALPLPLDVLVTDKDVEAVEGIRVVFEVDEGSGSLSETELLTDATGQVRVVWTLGDEPGNHRVTARTPDCGGANEVVFTATAEEEEVPSGRVTGALSLFETGGISPLAGATVTAESVSAAPALDRAFGATVPRPVTAQVTSDADGIFNFESLPVGSYELVVSDGSIEDTRVFGVQVTEDGLYTVGTVRLVRASDAPGGLDLDILRNPNDLFPVPSAVVELRAGVNAPDSEAVVASGTTGPSGADDQGQLLLSDVPAGTYTLKARAPGGGINYEAAVVIGGVTLSQTVFIHP